jgi:hypothetical protein
MRVFALFLALLIISPVIAAEAAPAINSISGTASDGQNVTISGSSFGSHGLAIQWLGGSNGTIEKTSTGAAPSLSGWNFTSFSSHVAATDQAHSGTKSLKNTLSNAGPYAAAIRYGWPTTIGPHQYIFASWWVRRTHTGSGQWKMFRLNWQDDITDDYPQLVMFNWDSSPQFFVRPGPNIEANTTADWSPLFPSQDNRWYRMDLAIYTSAVGSSDGSYTISLHDPAGGSAVRTETLSNVMSFYNSSRLYRWFLWQNYIGNGCISQNTWTDDIYVQVGTQARVELGDRATWSQCTFREIQRPTSWTNSEIQLPLNRGSFRVGDTAYLFVIDASGAASPGRAVTIGQTTTNPGTTPTPTPTPTPVPTPTPTPTPTPAPEEPDPSSSAWNADSNIGGGAWHDSSVGYCVRLLIPGTQITQSGNTVKLGFQGRSSGAYRIRSVSIAQRDSSGNVGDIVDSTWKKITFDKKAETYLGEPLIADSWESYEVVVPQGTEKVSNPIRFNIQQGRDYYVTFKIVTPSVYQNPPSGYAELYFQTADHTQNYDWSGTGFSTTEDYHALSNIYITNEVVSPNIQ